MAVVFLKNHSFRVNVSNVTFTFLALSTPRANFLLFLMCFGSPTISDRVRYALEGRVYRKNHSSSNCWGLRIILNVHGAMALGDWNFRKWSNVIICCLQLAGLHVDDEEWLTWPRDVSLKDSIAAHIMWFTTWSTGIISPMLLGLPGMTLRSPSPPAIKTAAAAATESIQPGTGSLNDAPIIVGRTMCNGMFNSFRFNVISISAIDFVNVYVFG